MITPNITWIAERVFKLQKRVVRLIKGCGYRDSCREHFRDMNILPLRLQHMCSLTLFAIKNRGIFATNRDCYETDTRQNMNIHMYQVNLAKYGKGVHHMAVRIYRLPNKLKIISNNSNKGIFAFKFLLYIGLIF
jgi:hypothetical protein